jgi:hypothetical protein
MTDSSQRALADTVFQRDETGERGPSEALRLEETRRATAVENMRRLKALRLAQNARSNAQ